MVRLPTIVVNRAVIRPAPAVSVLAVLAVTGCGTHGPRPASGAEPAVSPLPRDRPAGRVISVGALPEGVAVDPASGLVAVAVRQPNAIIALSASTGRVLWRVALPGHARHLGLTPTGTLLVPAETANRLLELSLRTRRLVSIRVGRLPHDAAAGAGRIFVTDEFGHAVSVISRGAVVGLIRGFRQPGGIAATGRDVAVVDVSGNTVTFIASASLRRLGAVGAGAGPTHVVAGAGGNLYVVDTRGQAILGYTTHPRLRLRFRYPLAGTPYGIAIDPVRGRLWVTLTATDRLEELAIGPGGLRLVRGYPTGRQPNTVAVDPRTGAVFVADAADGTLQIIRPTP